MGKFRALLIGIAEYEDQNIRQLPFVTDGLSAVGAALESRGYVVEEGSGTRGWVTGTELRKKVWRFIDSAKRGDALLIFLSGHGTHARGVDYLVPSDAELGFPDLAQICVPLTQWGSDLENTQAASVVFLIDACREGFDEQAMGAGRRGWSESKGLEVANRKIAFVFACPPGSVARSAVGEDDNGDKEEFSLFGRAIRQVAEDPEGPSTLAEFYPALEAAVREIAGAHGKPVQQVTVRTESDRDSFVVLPPGKGAANRATWRQLAATHPAWDCVRSTEDTTEPRAQADRLVTHLASAYQRTARSAATDPWDDQTLGQRIAEQAGFLLTKVLGNPELSPAEAALVATAPFVYASYWSAEGARLSGVAPADLAVRPGAAGERGAFERFARGHPRLLRRAPAAPEGSGAAGEIGWWIFHRWLARRPESYFPAQLEALLTPAITDSRLAADIWAPARTIELLRCFGADPGFLSRTDRAAGLAGSRPIAAGTRDEQSVRERLIGYLLAIAHRMAIEPGLLPGIVAEHLGIGDPVALPDLLRTVAAARWEPRGQSRVLSAACGHPAIEVALREHVRDLDALLADAHRLAETPETQGVLAPLGKLPAHAMAEGVGPAATADGRAYTSAGVRFRLDEDRVQQLLMGEQLYGDRALAIRELYQNALDACRYREKRLEYLRRTTQAQAQGQAGWSGLISFEQGVDDRGRPYIDCADNGIGMGIRELSEVFAQAGARFADLPEFLEEQAEWTRLTPPVELFPNSRFGIGVLSYFMLADEITITTCRLGRDGRPGRRLRVSIAGPGNLFRVVDLGDGADAGTTVRLHLRLDQDTISSGAALRDVLWVAQFETRARDAAGRSVWHAGQLAGNPAASVGYLGEEAPAQTVVGCANAPVWWTRHGGSILADGIATDRRLTGAVVNLNGAVSPPLSVDRRRIIGNRPLAVESLLERAIPELLDSGEIVDREWLSGLGEDLPGIADAIAQAAVTADTRWMLGGTSHGARRIGCFLPDDLLFSRAADSRRDDLYRFERRSDLRISELPDWIVAWRAAALGCGTEGGAGDPVVAALPSDLILVSHSLGLSKSWLDPTRPVPVGHLIRAALKLRRPVQAVAGRLAELGYQVPDVSAVPAELSLDDLVLVDPALRAGDDGAMGATSWLSEPPSWDRTSYSDEPEHLSQDGPVPFGHVLGAAIRLRCTPAEIAARLTALGYRVPGLSRLPHDLNQDDLDLLRVNLPGTPAMIPLARGRYLEPGQAAPLGHLLRAALYLRWSVGRVAERLAVLGLTVPDVSGLPDDMTEDDVELVAAGTGWNHEWLAAGMPVAVRHVLLTAARRSTSVTAVAARLTELGYQVPDLSRVTTDTLTEDDTELIADAYSEQPKPPVASAGQVLSLAARTGREASRVRDRLAALGCAVPGTVEPAGPSQRDDAALVSRRSNGRTEWLDPSRPRSLANILLAAIHLNRSPEDIAARLRQLGYPVPDVPSDPGDLSTDDLSLVRMADLAAFGRPAIRLPALVYLGAMLGRPVSAVSERLALLGFSVPAAASLPDLVTRDDAALVSRHLTFPQLLHPEDPVPLAHVLRRATLLRRDVDYVADRLAGFGYQRPDVSGLDQADLALIAGDARESGYGDVGDERQWLEQSRPVPLLYIAQASLASNRPAPEIAGRLRYLGFTVPDVETLLARGRPGPGAHQA